MISKPTWDKWRFPINLPYKQTIPPNIPKFKQNLIDVDGHVKGGARKGTVTGSQPPSQRILDAHRRSLRLLLPIMIQEMHGSTLPWVGMGELQRAPGFR